jgi:DNA recombination protein RmuC
METIVVVVVGLLAVALGILLGRYVWPVRQGIDPALLTKAQTDAARLNQECGTLRIRVGQLDLDNKTFTAEAKKAGEEVARLGERVTSLTKQVGDQEGQITAFAIQRDNSGAEAKTIAAEVAVLKEREASLTQRIAAQAQQLTEQQRLLTTEFENIANRILAANSVDLSKASEKSLSTIVEPLRDRIKEFQDKVESTYNSETRDVLSLKAQIEQMMQISNAVGNKADGLARALRNDSQQLGRWGELALERILEAAGLTEGREYFTQGKGLGLKSEDGGSQKPDVIVRLPEERTMIVDSKVPLSAYDRLLSVTDEVNKKMQLEQLVRDMKAHIDGLSGKRYQENEKLEAHDCVLMFVPIEGALAAALVKDPELFVYGWDRRVVIVGPPTLLMTMRTVASIWRDELQGENAQEIAKLAGDLCDKLSMSLVDLNSVAEKISGALTAHSEAVKRIASGKGNALSIGERIRSLGVKTKRPMPSMLVSGISITAQVEDIEEDTSPDPVENSA